ncbi:prephenate dehydrogenase [Candidatus Omnitrophota bacterium]
MRVAIIGGSGKMGRWLAGFLLNEGKEVVITGRSEEKLLEAGRQLGVEVATSEEAVKNADVVVISVPIDIFEQVVQQICPYTNSRQIIIDITSIKAVPVETMHKHIKAGLVLGVHPMFGPGAKNMENQNIVLTPTNEEETALAQKVRGYLEARGVRVSLMTPNEHDEMMAIILGLSHFIAIVSADTLLSAGRLGEGAAIGSTTYKVLLTLVGSVISEDPELYATLQMNLPNVAEIETLFQKKAVAWTDLVKNKDRQEFTRRLHALKNSLAEGNLNFQKAYENMYRIIDVL